MAEISGGHTFSPLSLIDQGLSYPLSQKCSPRFISGREMALQTSNYKPALQQLLCDGTAGTKLELRYELSGTYSIDLKNTIMGEESRKEEVMSKEK